jgi:outer membrane protein
LPGQAAARLFRQREMGDVRRHLISVAMTTLLGGADSALAWDIYSVDQVTPSAWIVEAGGYGVLEPLYEGSKHYTLSFKPEIDIWQAGSHHWLGFPNDAFGVTLYETQNFRIGPAGNLTLQSRYHGEDIDLRLGKADADLSGGAFAEYYPFENIRTRVELLQGITGNLGLAANLSADYIWHPGRDWTLTFGPRAQLANDQYASDFFSTQAAQKYGFYTQYRAEGGVISSGLEFTGKYELTRDLTTKFYMDFNQLIGDAADTPKVSVRGSSEQFIAGIGASYKFSVKPD